MDVIRNIMNGPLKVLIEKSEGLASGASTGCRIFVLSRFAL